SWQVVTNTRSPQTMGDECPLPGMGVFQRIFSVLLQRRGTLVSSDVPSPRGPRQPGQFSARVGAGMQRKARQVRMRGMRSLRRGSRAGLLSQLNHELTKIRKRAHGGKKEAGLVADSGFSNPPLRRHLLQHEAKSLSDRRR